MDMIERVARALCEDTLRRWRSPIALKSEPWMEFVPAARAAIEAMREPTEAMIVAGSIVTVDDEVEVWQTMIDAALSPISSEGQ